MLKCDHRSCDHWGNDIGAENRCCMFDDVEDCEFWAEEMYKDRKDKEDNIKKVYVIFKREKMSLLHKIFLSKEKAQEYVRPLERLYQNYLSLMNNTKKYNFINFYHLHQCLLYEISKYDTEYQYKGLLNVKFFPRYKITEKKIE